MKHDDRKDQERPFAMEFLQEIPDAALEDVSGGKKVETLALSLKTYGPHDTTIYDQF